MPLPPFIPPSQVLVDDRDSSIVYSDHNIKPGGRIGKEYNDTTTGLESNSSASFSFHGTYVAAYGTLGSTTGVCVVTYSIDNDVIIQTHNNVTGLDLIFGAPFFVSGTLPLAHHTLTMDVDSCIHTVEPYSAVWLDFLVYQPSQTPSSTSASPSPTPPAAGITTSVAMSSVTPGSSSAPPDMSPASHTGALQSDHVTIIVLAVMLGMVSLFAVVITAVAFNQRKRLRRCKPKAYPDMDTKIRETYQDSSQWPVISRQAH